jgi:hypothetical protein
VATLGGASGAITLAGGLTMAGNVLSNTSVGGVTGYSVDGGATNTGNLALGSMSLLSSNAFDVSVISEAVTTNWTSLFVSGSASNEFDGEFVLSTPPWGTSPMDFLSVSNNQMDLYWDVGGWDFYNDTEQVASAGLSLNDVFGAWTNIPPYGYFPATITGGTYVLATNTVTNTYTVTDTGYQVWTNHAPRIQALETGLGNGSNVWNMASNRLDILTFQDANYTNNGSGTLTLPTITISGLGGVTNNASITNLTGYGSAAMADSNSFVNVEVARATNNATSFGFSAEGSSDGAAVGAFAAGYTFGAAVGKQAIGYTYGAAVGYQASGITFGAAMGASVHGELYGAAVGCSARGATNGVAVGAFAVANGLGNVALGGGTNATSAASVTNGWYDTVELGRGAATLQGGLNFRGHGIVNSNGVVVAPMLVVTQQVMVGITTNSSGNVTAINYTNVVVSAVLP